MRGVYCNSVFLKRLHSPHVFHSCLFAVLDEDLEEVTYQGFYSLSSPTVIKSEKCRKFRDIPPYLANLFCGSRSKQPLCSVLLTESYGPSSQGAQ